MLKMGIPRPAVEMKMGLAGVDAGLLDQYGDGDGDGGGGGGGMAAPVIPPPARAPAPAPAPAAKHRPTPAPAPSRPARPAMGGGLGKSLLADLNKNRID